MPTLEELICPRDCPRRSSTCHSECKQHDLYRAETERRRREQQQEQVTITSHLQKHLNKLEQRFRR